MLFTTVISVLLALPPQDHDVRASPFDGLRWSDGTPETLIAGVWYQPVAIDGRDQFAYVSLNEVDFDGELERIKQDLTEPVSVATLAADLHRVLMRCGDGHARVSSPVPAGERGEKERTKELDLSSQRPTYGERPRSESRVLTGDLGYLRIARMNEDVESLRAAMDELVDTQGLVVDVRGNGGGSRDLLLALAGYLIGPDEPAVVGRVATYRLPPRFPDSHLEARFMYRADWSGWAARRRAAIDAFAPTSRAEWTPREEHREWHYLVMDRTGDAAEYFYDKPVVVLSDPVCFSATDIFLGALELLPSPEDFLREGGDAQLDAAIELLKE